MQGLLRGEREQRAIEALLPADPAGIAADSPSTRSVTVKTFEK